MRFQTTETVPTSDAEKVLHALEASLREFSDELERTGPRITVYGLGPSPRARNYRDTAVFDVTADSNATTIRADVTFQASALLGPSGQEEVVRSKLDYAFDQMRIQLGVPEVARENSPETMVRAGVVEAQQSLEAEHGFESSLPPVVDKAVESSVWSIPPEATDELPVQIEGKSDKPAPVSFETELGKQEREPSGAERTATPFSVWAASLRSVQVPPTPSVESHVEPSAVADEQEAEAPSLRFGEEAHKTNLPIVLAILLGVAVAAGAVYLYWAGLLHRMELGFVHPKTAAPSSQPAPPPVQSPVVVATAPPAPPRHEEAEPKVWLEQWADAMRSRDADLQTSFYADPVVRFQDDTNVGREALATFFRSQIQARNNLWTMRLERVSVEPITSSHVIARVSKHFMELVDSPSASEGNQITDRYVRSRLELRRTDGEWKIVSEQDVTPAGGTQ